MNNKLHISNYLIVGVMLFALFFGAGNLIFPAQLGQYAGTNLTPAILGFLITGVGLPLMGILAMSISGSNNLQELASRVHPVYGLFFTALLYLTIGPFFAAPRSGTVAWEIGFSSFIREEYQQSGLILFTLIFFGITLLLSLKPAKIVDTVGKFLAPCLVVLLLILLVTAFFNPIDEIANPQPAYMDVPFLTGFIEGYNTMDALASLVFGIIVINVIKNLGITSKAQILKATMISGTFAIGLLGIIYIGIAYIGATSVSTLGLFSTGGPVLSGAASYYFGTLGSVLLAAVIVLACLTTSIGLIIAVAKYFQTLFPKARYEVLVVLFTLITFIIANFGLANIITFSVPVLMFLYPLAITLMLLTFLSPLFKNAKIVYFSTTAVTFLISIFDGLKALCASLKIDYFNWMKPILSFYQDFLPLYDQGLGWLTPAIFVIIVTSVIARMNN